MAVGDTTYACTVTSRRRDSGAMPAGAIVAAALAITAVVGLIVGAVWGQIGGQGSAAPPQGTAVSTPAPASSTPDPGSASTPATSDAPTPSGTAPTDTGSSVPGASTPGGTTSPAPAPTGPAPSAPATTTTSADGWRLGSWKVTNTGGTLGIDTTARNTATGTRSATLVLYVYVNGSLIATTTAAVIDVPAGGTVPVHFSGTDPWQPGTKVLLLATG